MTDFGIAPAEPVVPDAPVVPDILEIPTIKIVLMGEAGSGKTSFAKLFTQGGFTRKYETTMGCKTYQLELNTNHGPLKCVLWDTAGQEKFGGLSDGYFVNCDVAFVFFDVTQRQSLNNTTFWMSRLDRTEPNSKIVLCGNKSDLAKTVGSNGTTRKVTDTLVRNHVSSFTSKVLNYVEMSCLTGQNVSRPLLLALQCFFKQQVVTILDNAVVTPQLQPIDHHAVDKLVTGAQVAVFQDDAAFDKEMEE